MNIETKEPQVDDIECADNKAFHHLRVFCIFFSLCFGILDIFSPCVVILEFWMFLHHVWVFWIRFSHVWAFLIFFHHVWIFPAKESDPLLISEPPVGGRKEAIVQFNLCTMLMMFSGLLSKHHLPFAFSKTQLNYHKKNVCILGAYSAFYENIFLL